jgi:CubicO group peptidase (beta-lactamase class C family)
MGENISAQTWSSARGLAKMSAFMAGKGSVGDKQLISQETWEDMHSGIRDSANVQMGMLNSFSKGGMNLFKPTDQYSELKSSPYYV